MAENTDTNDAAKPETASDADRLAKLTKAELIEQVLSQREAADRLSGRVDELLAREYPPAGGRWRFSGPEGASLAVTALLDLHRTVGAGSPGPTIRGKKSEASNRYLEAARTLGDALVDDILGPAEQG